TFNAAFFSNTSSRRPEVAGLWNAAVGSVFLLLTVLLVAFPVGVLTAVYLEEFAPDNWFTRTVEVNINNLAAVPSILFGLLGLALFIN
ncbi:phosphate ABC transporter, permease protein PstA, partial [Bacillus sp. SIMBA_161]